MGLGTQPMPDPADLEESIQRAVRDGNVEATREAVEETGRRLDCGELRVAEKTGDQWVTYAWVKQAILFYFRLRSMTTLEVGPFEFHDKVPLKRNFAAQNVRVVPHAICRYGAFLEP